MKRLSTIAAIMVLIFGFAMTAGAANENLVTEASKTDNIECGKAASGQDGQPTCPANLDYEDSATEDGADNGFCTGKKRHALAFDICQCEEATPSDYWKQNQELGIRMTIKIDGSAVDNGGFYWTNDTFKYAFLNAAGLTALKNAVNTTQTNANKTALEVSMAGYPQTDVVQGAAVGGNTVDYDYYNYNRSTARTPLAAGAGCVTADTNEAAIAETKYAFVVDGAWITNQQKYMWVNIPLITMNISQAIANKGKTLQVLVEILDNSKAAGTLCTDCAVICSTTVDIGIICCDDTTTTCIFFPYVVSGMSGDAMGNWNAAVAVTNTMATISADAKLTYTLTDAKGNVASLTKDFDDKVVATMIDAMLSDAMTTNASAIVAGPATLSVTATNATIDGISFMYANGMWSGSNLTSLGLGTLARTTCP